LTHSTKYALRLVSVKRQLDAPGEEMERGVGVAEVELMGRRGHDVMFGEEKDVAILGVTALEVLGLEVDPIKNWLKEAQLLMLSVKASRS
jgi:aspartyl protease family protein